MCIPLHPSASHCISPLSERRPCGRVMERETRLSVGSAEGSIVTTREEDSASDIPHRRTWAVSTAAHCMHYKILGKLYAKKSTKIHPPFFTFGKEAGDSSILSASKSFTRRYHSRYHLTQIHLCQVNSILNDTTCEKFRFTSSAIPSQCNQPRTMKVFVLHR